MLDFQNDMFDFDEVDFAGGGFWPARRLRRQSLAKDAFDRVGAVLLIVPLIVVTLVLLILNPFFNAGPLFFVQDRMGYQCGAFKAFKFRTMVCEVSRRRDAFDALETDRITVLGRFMRRTRIDELPQIINVLRGEMSLIGPRPDSYAHARVYLQTVRGYRERHRVMPGISGFAQTEVGYVDGLDGVRRKVAADLHYIAHASMLLDLWIAWRTFLIVVARKGA